MTNLNLNLYKVFCTVASSKNYTEASKKLNMSESNISNQISNLENQLGIKLFYRYNSGLVLTEIGRELLEFAETGIDKFNYIEKFIKEKEDISNATINIGCPSHLATYYLMDCIEKAQKDYPNMTINLYAIPLYKELLDIVKEHKLDFVISDVIPEDDKVFEQKKIIETTNVFVCNELIKVNDLKELENYKYILNFDNSISSSKLKRILLEHNIEINNYDQYDSTELRVNAAKRGLGIAYVMKQAVKKEIENKELYEIELPFELPKIKINVVYIKEYLSKVDKEFIKKYLN